MNKSNRTLDTLVRKELLNVTRKENDLLKFIQESDKKAEEREKQFLKMIKSVKATNVASCSDASSISSEDGEVSDSSISYSDLDGDFDEAFSSKKLRPSKSAEKHPREKGLGRARGKIVDNLKLKCGESQTPIKRKCESVGGKGRGRGRPPKKAKS